MSLPLIDDCDFYTVPNGKGQFIGRVQQFPDLRSSPKGSKAAAIDEIISKVSSRLAGLHTAHMNTSTATRHPGGETR